MKNKYIAFVAIGLELVGIVLACLYIGQKLDEAFGLKGLGMIGLSMAGLAGWIAQVVFLARKADRNSGD